jgi:phosphotransferase system HPr (HPr) family protein
MIEATIPVRNKVGLHARPAALFVQTAAKFSSTIKVKNLTATEICGCQKHHHGADPGCDEGS